MDIVLGVSMSPATIRMVLVEGENADGVTVDEDQFDLDDANDPAMLSTPDQVIAAILGTREGASQGGHQLTSTGVTWTDPGDAAALATALAARKVENVMLVSAFLAAAALAQTVGHAIGYEYIAMLFVEPDTATLAVVDSADGSITDVQRRPLRSANPVPELAAMIADHSAPDSYAEGLFIVGCDVDIAPIKPALEAASYLPVSAPEEPDMALARGAALASANAPLFASSTAALAYAQDPGTGEVDPYAVSPGYLEVPACRAGAELREEDLAYSAAPDQDADAQTGIVDIAGPPAEGDFDTSQRRRPLMLVGSALAVVVVSAALALEIALALGIRPAVALRPTPGQALIAPVQAAPSPPAAQLLPAPHPLVVHAAPPPVHLPAPVPIAPPAPVPVPIPAAPVPVPVPLPMHAGIPAPPVRVPLGQPRMNLGIPRPPLMQAPSMPPMREAGPQMRTPFPPFGGQTSQPPMNFPGSEGPRFPMTPGREGPRFPMMPGPEGPRFPGMPGPMMPRMPGPMFPRMPGPMMPGLPHFNFPGRSFRF
ncbi:DUF7159 family protein [Mycobacterium sp.]|uniref:DUF7159 family protein n=1 Tax=Mycobacterium sp. TaxID=1785 RepID=UPI003BEF3BDD